MTEELFFDTDCLSAFLWVNQTGILKDLYRGKIVIPGPVYQELSNPCIPHIKRRTDVLVNDRTALVREIEAGRDEYKLYHSLIKGYGKEKAIGKGEAAGIALAKVCKGVLASNNYADIGYYIKKYDLKHIDTGHIFMEALEKGVITEDDGNEIWNRMKDKNRKLPGGSFSEYVERNEKERDRMLDDSKG